MTTPRRQSAFRGSGPGAVGSPTNPPPVSPPPATTGGGGTFKGSGPGAVGGGTTAPAPTTRSPGTGGGLPVTAPPGRGSTTGRLPGSSPRPPGGFTQQPIRTPGSGITAEDARERAEAEEREKKNQRDAYAILLQTLTTYGLESLASTVQQWLVQGLSEAEILQRMRETPQFKERFPAIDARVKAGLSPLSPGEYVAYERNARQLMRAAGLPSGFYDSNDDFTTFLTNDLSISELGDRVTMAANVAFRMPKADRDALTEFGLGPGDITAFWLDPDKAQPLLERKYAAAQLAGSASQAGFGRLNETEATGLVQQGIGREQGLAGFTELTDQRELFTALDAGEDMIGREEQLGATFSGDARARRRIEQRARRRQAQFGGGGGFAASQDGLVGLGDN